MPKNIFTLMGIANDLVKKNGIFYKSSSDVPFTGKIDGKYNGCLTNGKKEGIWFETQLHDNKKIKSRGLYKDGKKEGLWEKYWDDPKVKYNKKTGQWEKNIEDEKLKSEGNFSKNKKEGLWFVYYSNG